MRYTIKGLLTRGVQPLRKRNAVLLFVSILAVIAIAPLLSSKNMFVFVDGHSMTVHRTHTQDPQEAMEEAGIRLGLYDSFSFPKTATSGGVMEVVIERSHTVYLEIDGEASRISTLGGTVLEVLERTGNAPSENDDVFPPVNTPVTDGMTIVLTRITQRFEQIAEPIAFITEYVKSDDLSYGEEKLQTEGADGQQVFTYSITLRGGVETGRELIRTSVVKKPQNEIILTGAKGALFLPNGEVLEYSKMLVCKATAYTTEGRRNKITATGTVARVGAIAVDPKVIPLKSRVYVEAADGSWTYGVAVCEDTGGSIKGDIVDLFFDTEKECWSFGVKKAAVYLLK